MVISESGLYKLVMRSDKPEARGYQDWMTMTVLPAIRKDGGYIAGEEFVATALVRADARHSVHQPVLCRSRGYRNAGQTRIPVDVLASASGFPDHGPCAPVSRPERVCSKWGRNCGQRPQTPTTGSHAAPDECQD
ncbi:hypothetical protein H7H48_06035 [Nitratireductor sp. B36]|nr:hypothetical protein [Nitratireductor sp. B36]